MESILIAVVHGPKNFPDAITTGFSVGQRADPHPIRVCAAASTESRKKISSRKENGRCDIRCGVLLQVAIGGRDGDENFFATA
jgi:hypothetical protein